MKICKNIPMIIEIDDDKCGVCGRECVFLLGHYCSFFGRIMDQTEDGAIIRCNECMTAFSVETT